LDKKTECSGKITRVRNYPGESSIPPAAFLQLTDPDPVFDEVRLEWKMACKKCASVAQQDFPGELSVVFPGILRLKLSPVYICQHILVCLDCAFTELVIPEPEFNRLRVEMAQSRKKKPGRGRGIFLDFPLYEGVCR
jgi:hypothetical protein